MERIKTGILIFDDVEVMDFAGPFEVFSRTRLVAGVESRRSEDSAPFDVFTVARTRDPITATGGLQVIPRYGFADRRRSTSCWCRAASALARSFKTRRSSAGSAARPPPPATSPPSCTGSLLLGKAGLLQGRRATTHWASLDLLESLHVGVTVERSSGVVDDDVITSAGVASGSTWRSTSSSRSSARGGGRDGEVHRGTGWEG